MLHINTSGGAWTVLFSIFTTEIGSLSRILRQTYRHREREENEGITVLGQQRALPSLVLLVFKPNPHTHTHL